MRMKRVSNLVSGYKYSLKKRISATYISIYIVICIVVMTAFVIGYAVYSCGNFADYTPTLAQRVLSRINAHETQADFRYYLLSLVGEQNVEEILVFDANERLIAATSYAHSHTNYF